MQIIHTEKAPEAIGPYSQAMLAGGLLFTSGQIAINPESGTVEAETIEGQAEQAMKNLGALLEAAGLTGWSRPPASWPTWGILPRSMRSMSDTLPAARPDPASRSGSSQKTCSSRWN